MRRRLSAILILAGLSTSSCAGRINNMMRSWEGAHYSDLIMRWGPPQGVYDDGQGGRILVYTTSPSWTTPGQATTNTSFRATTYDKGPSLASES